MAENLVNYKYTDTLENSEGQLKQTDSNDLVFVNKGFGDDAPAEDSKFGSIYKGDKLVGTTEADKLVVTEDIDVIGTNIGAVQSGDKFEKGTDILSILKELCRKELGVTKTLPTVSCINTGSEPGIYEVGTTIAPEMAAEYKDGSFDAVDGWGASQKAGCDADDPIYYKDSVALENSFDSHKLEDETVNYFVKQPYGASKNIPVSNTGAQLTDETIPAGNAISEKIAFTGAYKYFIGCYSESAFEDIEQYTSEFIRNNADASDFINSEDKTTINYKLVAPAGTKAVYIAIPKDVDDNGDTLQVTQISAFDLPLAKEMILNRRPVTITCAENATKSYFVFTWSFPSGILTSETFEISRF